MKSCAYCGANGPMTKEHVWPKALIQRYEKLHTYNPHTNRYFVGEPVVKDVCQACNNGELSSLDSYLVELYDNFFFRVLGPGEEAGLSYEYERLFRALLKISFNSCRSSNNHNVVAAHQRFVRFILGGGYCPKAMLRLQIVTSSIGVGVADDLDRTLSPNLMRCAALAYPGPLSKRFMVRVVGINSYWFYLVMSYKNEPDHKWTEFMEGFARWASPSGVFIERKSSAVRIPVEKTTYMHPQLLGNLFVADGD